MYKFIICIVCLSWAMALCVCAQTDSFLKTYQERVEKNPNEVSFSLKIKNDQTKFRQGEIIPLELKFATSAQNHYDFLNRTYDRSGRLYLDGFIIDKKEKTFDPLSGFFNRGESSPGGGMFTTPPLEEAAQTINYELNEYLGFKETGKYRLYIVSPRVLSKEDTKDNFSTAIGGGSSVSLTSNIIEFEILPADEKWQSEKFAEAVKGNCDILRYLGTKAAAREMLTRYSRGDKSCGFESYIGLYSSPERQFIVDEMAQMVTLPDFAVTNNFFQTLLYLAFFLVNPEPNNSESQGSGLAGRKRDEKKNLIKLNYLEQFAKALPNKTAGAFKESLETYFSFHAKGEKPPSPELLNALTSSFSKLPRKLQGTILENSLDKVKSPAMLPILKNIYDQLADYKPAYLEQLNADGSDRFINEILINFDNEKLINLSIKGIYELDRDLGKKIILDEIRRPRQRVHTDILQLLPKDQAAEVEGLLLEKLNGANIPADELGPVFMLINHYQTPKLISRLRESYTNQIDKIECGAQIELLRIYLKSDLEFGSQLLDKAVKADPQKNCYLGILMDVIEPYWSPEIERNVLIGLEDDNLWILGIATNLLGKYGSIEVRDKIWKRFERFNREEQIKKDSSVKRSGLDRWLIDSAEVSFVTALSEAPGWLFDRESSKRISKLCSYDYCKELAEKLERTFESPAKIETSFDEENRLSFSVNQYKNMSQDALKKKLAQFPPNTVFSWISNAENSNDEKNFQEVKGFVEKNGMKLIN